MPTGVWFSATAGTLAVEGIMPQVAITTAAGQQDICGFDDGTINNATVMRSPNGSAALQVLQVSANVGQPAANTANLNVAGALFKGAISYSGGNLSACLNAGGVVTATGTPPVSLNRLNLGAARGFSQNGYKSRIRYWNTALLPAQLQMVTM